MIIIMMKELHIMIRKNYTHRQRQRRTTSLCRRRRRFSVDLLHKYNYDNKKGRLIIDFFRIYIFLLLLLLCFVLYRLKKKQKKKKRRIFLPFCIFQRRGEMVCMYIYCCVKYILKQHFVAAKPYLITSRHIRKQKCYVIR